MADIAESTPAAEMNLEGAETKEAKTCELTKEVNEKGDCGIVAENEAETKTCTEATTAEVVGSAVAETTADTTEASPCTGTKRKAEDEVDDEPKKSKPEDATAEEAKDSEAVPANGVSSNGDQVTDDSTKALDDIQPEVVTKTVEDVLKHGENVEASS
jgi:hypothetical protein